VAAERRNKEQAMKFHICARTYNDQTKDVDVVAVDVMEIELGEYVVEAKDKDEAMKKVLRLDGSTRGIRHS
jgi:hypothetical protein